jgi:hypothetical protein
MSNKQNGEHSTPVVLFGAAVMIALLAVTVMTFERGDTRTATNEAPSGTTGLAKTPPPLDLASDQPVTARDTAARPLVTE